MATFTDAQIEDALIDLPGWSHEGEAIVKTFTFDDFVGAIAFMSRAAPGIDALDHHPEWTNVYNRVDVRLNSHDVGGVTDRDVALAKLLQGFV